jgi:hypothetical protein
MAILSRHSLAAQGTCQKGREFLAIRVLRWSWHRQSKKNLHQYHQELTVPRILGLFSRLRRSPSRSLALHSLRFHIQYPRVSHKIASQIRNTKSISIRSFPLQQEPGTITTWLSSAMDDNNNNNKAKTDSLTYKGSRTIASCSSTSSSSSGVHLTVKKC